MWIREAKLDKMQFQSTIKQIKESKSYLIALTLYAFLFLFFCSKMSPLYPTNEWEDVNVYFNIGKGIMEGRTLYSEIFDPKGPFIFLLYGFGYLISHTSFIALYIFFSIGWAIALYSIFRSVETIFNGKKTLAFLTALLTPIVALQYIYVGGSAEEIILIAQCVSLYIFISYFNRAKTGVNSLYILGITTSIIIFTKINLSLFCFFPLLAIFIDLLSQKKVRPFLASTAYYLLGFGTIALPICFYLWYNNALEEAFNTYILLNKHLAVNIPIQELIKNGASRFYTMFRENLIGATLVLIGIFYFPIRYISVSIAKTAFILSGITMISIIFFAGVFHFYYPLPLYIFAPLGLIVVFGWLDKYITIEYSAKVLSFFAIFALLLGIAKTSFFEMGGSQIARQVDPEGPAYQFKHIIDKEKNPNFLNLAYGNTIGIYTICNIIPDTRFFTSLNIAHELYPTLRDEQTKYVDNQQCQFIALDNLNPNFEHFKELPSLQNNYSLIDSCLVEKTYIDGQFHIYYLYKRND